MAVQYTPKVPVRCWLDAPPLQDFCARVFVAEGLPENDADIVAESLVAADLRGVHSHGVTRMDIYTERLRRGLFNPRPQIKVNRTAAGSGVIDGDNGMGAVVGMAAVDAAMAMAGEAGIGAVTVHHGNHFGTAAYYIAKAVERGFVALVCSNAPPTMAPWGGREAMFGTNPIGYGVPTGGTAIIADLATSVVARGKIILASQRKEQIPLGWALDVDGRPTTDPDAALIGAVLPFGEYKGSAIAMLVELLAGRLSGSNSMREIPDFYRDLDRVSDHGHFFLCLDVGHFMPPERFQLRVDDMITSLKQSKRAAGCDEILMPGEIEARLEADRRRTGIPLTDEIVLALQRLGERHGIGFPVVSERPLDRNAA